MCLKSPSCMVSSAMAMVLQSMSILDHVIQNSRGGDHFCATERIERFDCYRLKED